ncbi:hypothetical protein [Pseudonocardia sp. WMMC193]|uniref:hypothetical protein n=1 Tax=Pseudonocardia sp. WMMC193 TaxID=2911965 RepID=UPI001F3446F8|nr:hypothetical protein [Pseudonocardia sp. WMMC193]MCF7550498.1 hypothetical protein [Pseudonocardia sp. WMMC193]
MTARHWAHAILTTATDFGDPGIVVVDEDLAVVAEPRCDAATVEEAVEALNEAGWVPDGERVIVGEGYSVLPVVQR